MKNKVCEKLWNNLEHMPLDELNALKLKAGEKIRWARFAFDPKKSMNSVGSDPRFKKIFPKTGGYSEHKFKEVENGEFGKKTGRFRSFIEGIAQYYNLPAYIFIDNDIKEIEFQNMIRQAWKGIYNQEKNVPALSTDLAQAPDVSFFYGRDRELNLLKSWIVKEKSKIAIITGMGGIGKTRLAAKFVACQGENTGDFDFIIWISLVNAPEPADVLHDLIYFFSGCSRTDIPFDMNAQMKLLFHYLCNYSCLMVLDNLETVLEKSGKAGRFTKGFEAYGQIFRQIGETAHKSCLILTGREMPGIIDRISGNGKHVRILNLEGIGSSEGMSIFKDAGISITSETEIDSVTDMYKGNPLALELAAKHVESVFFGSISEFLNSGISIFDDIGDLLKEHFDRLSIREQEVLFWLAVNRESVSLADLKQDIVSHVSKSKLPSTLQSLQRRLPLEKRNKGFSLQPVMMDFITGIFINLICKEIVQGEISLLDTHGIMKAESDDYIRNAQKRVIVDEIIRRSVFNNIEKCGLKQNLDYLLEKIRISSDKFRGYAAGNIINLFCISGQALSGYKLSGYNFSGMKISQAYLQGVHLHRVDFSRSEFDRSVFTQPTGTVMALDLSSDSRYLAVADSSRDIKIKQADTGQTLYTLKGHENWIRALDFSCDSMMLASCGEDKTVRMWDTQTGRCLQVLKGHEDRVEDVVFDKLGRFAASAGYDSNVLLWDMRKGECVSVFQGHSGPVYSCAFSPDGKILASAGADKTIRIWNTGGKRNCISVLKGHKGSVRAIAFNSYGTLMASAGEDSVIYLRQASDFKNLFVLKGHKSRIRTIAFNNDSILVSAGEDQKVRVWDIKARECVKVLSGHSNRIRSLVFGHDNKTIYTGSDDQTVKKWNLSKGECLKTFTGYTNYIRSVKFSSDGMQVAGCSQEHGAGLWNIKENQIRKILATKGHWALSSKFTTDNCYIFSTGKDLSIRIWEMGSGREIQTFSGHENWVREILMTHDGRVASCSDDQSIKIWDVETGQCLKTLRGHENRVCALALSFDDSWLASGSYDLNVRIWNMKSGRCAKILAGHESRVSCLAYCRENKFLASGSGDQDIRIWDFKAGKCLKILKGHENWVKALAFCPESRILASGSEDHSIRIWDFKAGKCLKILTGHNNWIMSLDFNPKDRTLASSSVDGSIKLWDIKKGLCLKTFCPPRPYEGMNIEKTKGLSGTQKNMLMTLGAKCKN